MSGILLAIISSNGICFTINAKSFVLSAGFHKLTENRLFAESRELNPKKFAI